jgi:hypothetical protein
MSWNMTEAFMIHDRECGKDSVIVGFYILYADDLKYAEHNT